MGDLASKVTAALQGSDSGDIDSDLKEKVKWYRVRKTWADSKSQKGAFKILGNAKKCADQNQGYKVFDADGNVVYEPKTAADVPYLVKVDIPDLNIRKGPGVSYDSTGQYTGIGIFTIVAEQNDWGKLKSGAGWICLGYTKRI